MGKLTHCLVIWLSEGSRAGPVVDARSPAPSLLSTKHFGSSSFLVWRGNLPNPRNARLPRHYVAMGEAPPLNPQLDLPFPDSPTAVNASLDSKLDALDFAPQVTSALPVDPLQTEEVPFGFPGLDGFGDWLHSLVDQAVSASPEGIRPLISPIL